MGEFRYIYTEELYHHGILGQKWGVRRFQNKDGSLTSAGKKRRGVVGTIKQINRNHKRKQALKKARKTREENRKQQEELNKLKAEYRKSPKAMLDHQELFSNEEIAEANARFKLLNETSNIRLDKIGKYADVGKKVLDAAKVGAEIAKTGTQIYTMLDANKRAQGDKDVNKVKKEADLQEAKNRLATAKEASNKSKKTPFDLLKEQTDYQEQLNKLNKAKAEGEEYNPLSAKALEKRAKEQISFNKSQIDLDESNKSYNEHFGIKDNPSTGNTGNTGNTGKSGKTSNLPATSKTNSRTPSPITSVPKTTPMRREKQSKSKSERSNSAWDAIKRSMATKGFVKTTKLPRAATTTLLSQNRASGITSDAIRKGVSKYGMTKYNDVGRYIGNDKTDQVLRDFMSNAHKMSISEVNDWLNSH